MLVAPHTVAAGAGLFGFAAAVNDSGATSIARLALTGAALAVAAVHDVEQRRIPNRVTIPAALALLALWAATGAAPGRIAAGLTFACGNCLRSDSAGRTRSGWATQSSPSSLRLA